MDINVQLYKVPVYDKDLKLLYYNSKITISAVSFVSMKFGDKVIPSAKVSIALPNQVGFGNSKSLEVKSQNYIRGGGQYTYIGEATFDLPANAINYSIRFEGDWVSSQLE